MKKKYLMILTFILFLFTGCGTETKYNIEQIYDTDKEYPAQSYWWDDTIKKTENGYYYLDFNKLYFWDIESQSGSIVCSASNCKHNDSNCNGYLGEIGKNGCGSPLDLEIYNDHIYKIVHEIDETMDVYIYSISMDGSTRQKMGYLYSKEEDAQGGFSFMYDWVMIDGYYYGVFEEENERGLYKIRIDGEKTLVYDVSEIEDCYIERIKGIGNYVYFTLEGYEDDENYVVYLMRYNTKTEETEKLTEDISMCDYCFLDENQIIYSDIKGNCNLINAQTGEITCMVETNMECMVLSSDGKYLYIDTFGELYIYDIKGNLIDVISDEGTVLFGDEQYLFINSSTEPGTEANENNGNNETNYLWILDKSQLGQENKEWMKMELE